MDVASGSIRAARASILAPFLGLLVIGGCDDAGFLGPGDETPSSNASVDRKEDSEALSMRDVPFQLDASAVLLGQVFAPDFGPPLFGRSTFEGRCSQPADFLIRFGLEGEATHLGRFSGKAEHCTMIDFATGAGREFDGEMVLVAANGDELWDSYETPLDSDPPGTERHVFVGGTGRFVAASGGGAGDAACDRATGTCVFWLAGSISYDASDRAAE